MIIYQIIGAIIIIANLILGIRCQCGIGCVSCDSNLNCLQCGAGFQLNSIQNNCVYINCPQGLFFQQNSGSSSQQNPQSTAGTCQAICDDNYYQSKTQNLCVNFDSCSFSFMSYQNVNLGDSVLNIIPYNSDYFIVVYAHYIDQISRSNGQYQQQLDLSENLLGIIGANQFVYILLTDLTFYEWDISYNNQKLQTSINQSATDVQNTYLINIQNTLIVSVTQLKTKSYLAVQQLLTISTNTVPSSMIELQLSITPTDQIQIKNQFILYGNGSGVRIDEIIANNQATVDISYFTQKQYVCTSFPIQTVLAVSKSVSGSIITVILSQSSQLLIIQGSGCQQVQLASNPSQIIPFSILGVDYLLITFSNNLSIINLVTQKQVSQLNIAPLQIIDMNLSQITNQSNNSQTLILLLSNSNVVSYSISLVNNSIQITQINSQQLVIPNPTQIFILSQIPSASYNERIIISGADIQAFLTPNQQSNTIAKEKQSYITMNYNLDYDDIPTPLVETLILTTQKTLISCTNDGRIYSWDNSFLYNDIFQNYLYLQNSSCIKLKAFNIINQFDVIALMNNQFILFDSFSFTIKQQVLFTMNPQPIPPLITDYQKQTVLLYDQSLYYISQDTYNLIQLQFQSYTSDIAKISLQSNNYLIIQKTLTLEVYTITINQGSQSTVSLVNTYTSASPIQIWRTKLFPQPQYSQYFEIYVFAADTSFNFIQMTSSTFSSFQTITGIPLSQGVDITFIKNSPTDIYYFLVGKTNQKAATLPYQAFVLKKNSQSIISFFSVSSVQQLIQPVTYYDSNNSLIYDVKVVQSLSFQSSLITQTFNTQNSTNFQDETTILLNVYGSYQLPTQDLSYSYVYDQNGFLGVNLLKNSFYSQLIQVPTALYTAGDVIQDVQMSYVLNKYFVIRLSIYIFNINDNSSQGTIAFEVNTSSPIIKFIILESDQVVIGCKANIIKLMNFATNKLYTYTDSTLTIIKIIITPYNNQNMITVYGSSILILDETLTNQTNQSISFSPSVANSCYFPTGSIICLLSSNYVVILDSIKLTITTQFQSRNLSPPYQIQIDQSNDRLYLYTDSIEVYNLKGVFQQKITQSSGSILQFNIFGNSIALVTSSTLVIFDSVTLTNRGSLQGSGGGQILNILYIKEYNHLLAYTNIIRFAQVFIFSLDTLLQVSSLKSQLTQNSVTLVVDSIYDSTMNIFSYLDQTGSVSFIDYTGTYQQINVLKIREFNSGINPPPVGMRLCKQANILLVFSSNMVYTANYAQMSDSYQRYSLMRNNFYVEIDLQNQVTSSVTPTFIFLGSLNTLYIYSQEQFQFFVSVINSQNIIDLNFVSNSYFVLAFNNEMLIYNFATITGNLAFGIDTIVPVSELRYKFTQFLCPNVFLTQDQKLIHYDFTSQTQLKQITLNTYQRITSQLFLSQQQILILGFNDGTAVIYNLNSQTTSSINLQLSTGATSYDDVHFIFQTTNFIWLASLNSQVVSISITTMTESGRFNFVSLMGGQSLILGVINIDEQNSRIFMNFFKEKIVRCLNLSNQQLIMNLSFPDAQYNRIAITPTLVIFYSTFQLNIHNRTSLLFLTMIRRQNLQDQIVSIYTFNDKYFFILSLNKFELFKVDVTKLTIKLFDQVQVYSFKLMHIALDNTSQTLRVIGLSNQQLFDQIYSMGYYELQSYSQTQCSLTIKDQTYLEMQQSVSLIIPLYTQLPTLLGLVEQSNSSSNTYFTIYLDQQDLSEVNVQATFNSQITIIPQTGTNPFSSSQNTVVTQTAILNVYENTFTNYPKQYILIKNFNLVFQNTKQSIGINANTTNTYFQDISISNQILQDIQIDISNNTSVIIMNLILENLNITYTNPSLAFLLLDTCASVQIYNLVLNNVNVVGLANSLISIIGSTNVIINQITVKKCTMGSFISSTNVQNFVLSQIMVTQCTTLVNAAIDNLFLLNIQGTQNLSITSIIMENNIDVKFLYTQNTVKKQLQTITLNTDQVYIGNAQIDLNTISYSQSSPLFQFYSTNLVINTFNLTSNSGNLQFMNSQNVAIINSTFFNNSNTNGGAVAFINIKTLINITSTSFIKNEAFGSGGAIFCQEFIGKLLIDTKSFIKQNNALIGGGVRVYNVINNIRDNEMKKLFESVNIDGNTAQFYGQQYATFLQQIAIVAIQSDSSSTTSNQPFIFINQNSLSATEQALYSGKLVINDIRSGSELDISLLAMDSNSDYIKFSTDELKAGQYPSDIQSELLSYYFKIDSEDKQYVLLNGETLITSDQYNQQKYLFSFNEVQISSYPQTSSSMLINYQINNQQNLPILVNIQFRSCLVGETIKVFSSNILSCQLCPEGSFSLIIPSLAAAEQNSVSNQTNTQMIEENSQCQQCPDSADLCQGSSILLKDGYWRSSLNSSEIIYCENNPNNCQSQNPSSLDGCVAGTLGPLCEECDTYGTVWQKKSYTRSFDTLYVCEECSDMSYQIFFFITLSFVLIFYSLMSTFIFMSSFMYTQTCYYLRQLSIFPISRSSIRDQSSFYLKILMNYLQLSTYLIYFKIQILPQAVSDFFNLLQSPAYKMTVSIDCILSHFTHNRVQRIQSIQIVYLLLPIIYSLALIIVLKCLEWLKRYSVKSSHIYTQLNFLFVFFQPSQITYFTQSLSCRSVGTNSYQEVDLLIKCNDSSYNYFSIPFSIAVLILWILVPLVIFLNLKKQKNNLNYCIVKYKYGYYYSEFKQPFYYWEFVRLNLRITVVMIFTLMQQNIYLVYLLIIFIFGLYIKSVLVFSPIQNKKLQKFEIMANQVIILNLILTSVSITFPSEVLSSFIYGAHLLFVFYIITVIIGYKVNSKLNIVGRIIRWLLQKLLSKKAFDRFQQRNTINFMTYKRWKLIKNNLSQIIGLNALQKAQKAANSQQNSAGKINRYDETQTQILSQIHDASKSAFHLNAKDEILENDNKLRPSYSKHNSLTINIKEDIPLSQIDDTHTDLHAKKQELKENYMIDSKFSNFSEQLDLGENEIVTFQQSVIPQVQHALPGEYNLNYICKSELDKKKTKFSKSEL